MNVFFLSHIERGSDEVIYLIYIKKQRKNLQWTSNNRSSFNAVCGIGKLSARQVSCFPLSSTSGTNVTVDIVALPSSFTESRTFELRRSEPSHHETCAAGREPNVRHWNSAFEPADKITVLLESDIPVADWIDEVNEVFVDEPLLPLLLLPLEYWLDFVNILTSSGRTIYFR